MAAPSGFCDVMFRQTAYAASSTLNRHDLLFHQLAEAHEDRGDLGAGGVRLRVQLAVRALNQALTNGPRTDVGSVRKLGQILRERDRFEAVFHGIAEEHRHKLLARDRAGHIRAVGDFVLHCPALTSGVPRRASGALAVQTRRNGHDHAARGIRVRGELVLARAVHETLVDHIVDGRSVPSVVRNVHKSGLIAEGAVLVLAVILLKISERNGIVFKEPQY